MIIERIKNEICPGDVIPKPKAKQDFKVKGWGKRRNKEALIYTIPNHKTPEKPYEKGVNLDEIIFAYEHLLKQGDFTRDWFNKNLSSCAKEGGCNFTTIGGVFELLGLVRYFKRGTYLLK